MLPFGSFLDELEKIAFSREGFWEGVKDEGIPLAGATVGAIFGGLRGAALGYGAGSAASVARSYIKGEKPSLSRTLLAASGAGYALGGGLHFAGEKFTANAKPGSLKAKIRPAFHEPTPGSPTYNRDKKIYHGFEEGLPAVGATLGAGIAMGSQHKPAQDNQEQVPVQPQPSPVKPRLNPALTNNKAVLNVPPVR